MDVDLRGSLAFCGPGEGGDDCVVAATDERDRKWPNGRADDERDEGRWCCDQPATWMKLDKMLATVIVANPGRLD